MSFRNNLAIAAAFACILFATPQTNAADNLQSVLDRLDRAAANFRTTSADFVFDTETLQPVADSDIQKGVVDYEHRGGVFKMAAHIEQDNGHPITRIFSFANGLLTYYDQPTNQVTRFSSYSKYESYFMLGFGASGKELASKWNITDLGPETIDGIQTEKLQLIAKQAEVRKNIPRVTIWIDPDRAVSLRQRFDEGPSGYRICTYSNFRINQSLPRDAFSFKTAPHPTIVNR